MIDADVHECAWCRDSLAAIGMIRAAADDILLWRLLLAM